MNKADLQKWSKYCNTDKLVDDMMELLKHLGHRRSEHGVCVLLDKYFKAKEPLIKSLMTSNHYAGGMRIILQKEFDRDVDRYAVMTFVDNFPKAIDAKTALLKYEDEDGKTVTDYLSTGSRKVEIAEFIKKETTKTRAEKIANFDSEFSATKASAKSWYDFQNHIERFRNIYVSTMYENYDPDGVDIKKGMKTSRAFNKVCTYYGIDKAHPKTVTKTENGETVTKTVYPYDKLFAQYADMVSGNTRKLPFIISVNPLDYLTMSLGNSWQSCHSTRSTSGNGVANMAASGCVSYMLDKVSIITFVVPELDENIHMQGKLYRQMYYYNDELFIQSRLYPQGNDGSTDLYAKFRSFVQEEFSELLGIEDEWTNCVGGDYAANYSRNQGAHYVDANHNPSCGIFYPKGKENKLKRMTIGSKSYCFYCGEEQEIRNRLSHADCTYE